MNFRNLELRGVYRTSTHSLMRDFYIPVLSCSLCYDRAVGFFSSSTLVEAATGIAGLIRNHGKMRLIIGHPLQEEDWDAVTNGSKLSFMKDELCARLSEILEKTSGDRSAYALQLLSWLVATGGLELRFAVRKAGMYHEKIGIMKDADQHVVVFHGSANESAAALLPDRNFESLAVYHSWRKEVFAEYGQPFVQGFEDLWENKTPGVITIAIPSAVYEIFHRSNNDLLSPPDLNLEEFFVQQAELGSNGQEKLPQLPLVIGARKYELGSHQSHALKRWSAHGYSGILALATGSGKTITVLHAATRFSQQEYRFALVVAVPYQILGEQWCSVMKLFNMEPIKAFYSQAGWWSELADAISGLLVGARKFVAVVVVNPTLSNEGFQNQLRRLPADHLFFVGDECHHHGSRDWQQRIPIDAKFKAGLSATPWNPSDLEKRNVLETIYGPVVATYSLKDALDDGVLTRYDYFVLPCSFDDDEAEEYEKLSVRIAQLVAQAQVRKTESLVQQIQGLAARRHRLLGALRDKTRRLRVQLEAMPRCTHSLFYCGEGSHPIDGEQAQTSRVVDWVLRLITGMGWKAARITAAETASQRERILEAFSDGFFDAVVAMRVLDEGFDIPSCRTAFILASNASYRQFVQRRGRILRRAPGKDTAYIYDFVPLPSSAQLASNPSVWRRQAETEMFRVREFASMARNATTAEIAINEETKARGLGTILYSDKSLDEEELYGYSQAPNR